MQTTRYRYRNMPDHIIEAVQLTADNERDVFEWAPGKQFYEPGGTINGLTIFTPEGRRRAVRGDWVYRDEGTDRFWTTCQDAFDDDYEQVA
jgi:hypothetical protein